MRDKIAEIIDAKVNDFLAYGVDIKTWWSSYSLADQILDLPAEGWVVDCKKLSRTDDFVECSYGIIIMLSCNEAPDGCTRPATLREVLDGKAVKA